MGLEGSAGAPNILSPSNPAYEAVVSGEVAEGQTRFFNYKAATRQTGSVMYVLLPHSIHSDSAPLERKLNLSAAIYYQNKVIINHWVRS